MQNHEKTSVLSGCGSEPKVPFADGLLPYGLVFLEGFLDSKRPSARAYVCTRLGIRLLNQQDVHWGSVSVVLTHSQVIPARALGVFLCLLEHIRPLYNGDKIQYDFNCLNK